MYCLKCGKEMEQGICPACGFNIHDAFAQFLSETKSTPAPAPRTAATDLNAQFEQGKACFQAGDYTQAFSLLEQPARKGNKHAQFLMGQICDISGKHRNASQAMYWYEQAAARGEPNAITLLIRHYEAVAPTDPLEKERIAHRLKQWRAKLTAVKSAAANTAGTPAPRRVVGHFVLHGTVLEKSRSTAAEAVIPNGVTEIAPHAFEGNTQLRSLVLPGSVRKIGEAAFSGCVNLEHIRFSDGLEEIGDKAFRQARALRALILPDSLRSIGSEAFRWCDALEHVRIPDRVSYLGDSCFELCIKLASVTLPLACSKLPYRAFRDCGLKELTIPGNFETIGIAAFSSCSYLTQVKFESGVRSIGANAFGSCYSLKTVVVPDTLTEVDNDAFDYCDKVTTVLASEYWKQSHPQQLKAILPYVDDADAFVMNGTKLVKYCGKAEEPVIPAGTSEIGDGAFQGNRYIQRIVVPDSVQVIGKQAFAESTVVEVLLSDSIHTLGNGVFEDSDLETVRLPVGLTRIPDYTFSNTMLEEVEIPEGVTEIGEGAFSRSCLSTVELSEHIQSIGAFAFQACSLDEIRFPSGMTQIPEGAFAECEALETVIIPENIAIIGQNAFRECTALTTLVLSDGVEEVGDGAFAECSSLEELSIPDSVSTIATNALEGVQLLKLSASPKWQVAHADFIRAISD